MQVQQSSIFEFSNFGSKLSEKLLTFSENKKFSDICIVTSDDVRFHAHKCVLSAFSDFFSVMFESGMKEASASEVKIHEVNGKVFKPILNFLYTGRIELQNDTIEDILRAANFFQIIPLISECYNFMSENLDAKNCLSIALFADQHGFVELFKKTFKFASENFEKVCGCKEFLKLKEHQLSAIVWSEDLCVTSEEAVFFNLIKWIEYDKPNREKSTCNLFSKFRYWLLRPEFIKQHRSKLPNKAECLEMVCTWLEWHSSPESRGALKPMAFSKPKNAHGILFVGGRGIQTYDYNSNTWSREEVSKLPCRFDNIIIFENQLIFAIEDCSLTSFNLQTREITNFIPRMITPRRSYALAVLNKELYVIGGYNGEHNWLRVVEKYNFTTAKWHTGAPMNNIIASPKAAVVNGELYVVGKSHIMECLDRFTHEWRSIPFLPDKPKSEFGFTALSSNLYKIGGFCDLGYSKKISCFDTNSNKVFKTYMKIPLAGLHCIGKICELITCGGRDDTGSYLNLVQEYNMLSGKWRILSSLIEYNPLNYDYGLVEYK